MRVAGPDERFQRMVALRRDLRRRPELSGSEKDTARRIAAELDTIGVSFTTGVAGHGVVAEIPGAGDGPTVALRAGTPAHSSKFDFDERALSTGAAWLASVARIAGSEL